MGEIKGWVEDWQKYLPARMNTWMYVAKGEEDWWEEVVAKGVERRMNPP